MPSQQNGMAWSMIAISNINDKVDDVEVGKHPLVARLFNVAFHTRSSLPKYTVTWNVQVHIMYLNMCYNVQVHVQVHNMHCYV